MALQIDTDALAAAVADSGIPGILSVYLFGSGARGQLHEESDVDIGVLLDRAVHPSAKERFDARLLVSSRISPALAGRTADVVILNDAPPLFGRRIVTDGIRIVCSDAEADHAFCRDIQLLAADLEPFLRRMRILKLEALAPR